MRILRSIGVWIAIACSTVLFGLPAIPAAFLPPRGDWFLRFARGWARTILAVSGISVRVLRADRLRTEGSFVIVANHESFTDILVLLANLPVQLRFLAKRSIFRIPILGWSIRAAGFVPVDRGNKTRSAATVEAALSLLEAGRSLVLFPEETRTRTGELLPFRRGAALLALRSRFPLLPLGLAGTRRLLPRGTLLTAAGQVVLSVGEPIRVDGRSPRDRDAVTEEVRREILKLRAEAAEELLAARR